jgi:carbonic anhydrase
MKGIVMHNSRRHIQLALLALASTIPSAAPAQPSGPQSPINIERAHACVTQLPRLVATRRSAVTEVWRNTGSPDHEETIRVSATPPAGSLELDGKAFTLRQYHLHVPAEHPINGVVEAMEIHYVHEAEDGSVAVIALIVKEGAYNAAFNPLLAAMPDGKTISVTTENADPLGHFLRPWLDQPKSYRYIGSLTTPPFSSGVRWVVLAEPISFSAAQMARFKGLFPHGNVRPVQDIDRRVVKTDVANFSRPC